MAAFAQRGYVQVVSRRAPIVCDPAKNILHRHAPPAVALIDQCAVIQIAPERNDGGLAGRNLGNVLGDEMGQNDLARDGLRRRSIDDFKVHWRARAGRLTGQSQARRNGERAY